MIVLRTLNLEQILLGEEEGISLIIEVEYSTVLTNKNTIEIERT